MIEKPTTSHSQTKQPIKTELDPNNPVVKLCIESTQAEFRGQNDLAERLCLKAWEIAQNAFESCIAAHYAARYQKDPQDMLRWNQIALAKAKMVPDQRMDSFYPSLCLNIGHSFELLGMTSEAKRYFDLAAELGFPHQITSEAKQKNQINDIFNRIP